MKMRQPPEGWSNTIADTSSLNACMHSASKLLKVNSHKRKDFNMVSETHYYQKPSLRKSGKLRPAFTVIEVTELLFNIGYTFK